VTLSSAGDEARLASSKDGGRVWETRSIEELRAGSLPWGLAVAGDAIAITGDELLVARGLDAPLEAPEGCERCVAATFAGTETTSPLLALLLRDDGAYLARIDASNEARLVADLTRAGEDTDIGASSMAWDDARGVVWIACAWGLFALAPPR
jgi:hypothetical protein